jgi:hypothetical protein
MYITKELKFIYDTIKFMDELKLRYPNKILAPINTGLAKSYSDERDDNTVSVKDNKESYRLHLAILN